MANIRGKSHTYQEKTPVFSKIPARFPTQDKRLVKAYATFAALKQIKFNGTLHAFKRNIKHYANVLKVHPNTLRTRAKDLLHYDFARYEGQALQLNTYRHVFGLLSPTLSVSKRFYKFTGTCVKAIELYIYACAIKENYRKQEYKIKQKIFAYEVSDLKACDKHQLFTDSQLAVMVKRASQRTGERAYDTIAKKFLKHGYDAAVARHTRTWYQVAAGSAELPAINPIKTLSCHGVARVCLGKSNRSTGYYLQRLLADHGHIQVMGCSVVATPGLQSQAAFYEPFGFYTRPHKSIPFLVTRYRTLENRINIG